MESDVSKIIERTALIENILNQVIYAYLAPRKEVFTFVWNILFDSSVMPLGSKIKVAMAISQALKFKLNKNALHQVISLRNAFAHHALNSHPTLLVNKTTDKDESKFMLQILSQSGKIQRLQREEALAAFDNHFNQAKDSLLSLLKKIKDNTE